MMSEENKISVEAIKKSIKIETVFVIFELLQNKKSINTIM